VVAVAGKLETHQQGEALCNFEDVFLGAPFALKDDVAHDVQGVGAAQATKVHEGHRCPRLWSDFFFNFKPMRSFPNSKCLSSSRVRSALTYLKQNR